jgi:Predicted membrane protein
MSQYQFICVLIMAVLTYLPRMLPLTFFRKDIESTFIQSLLYYVPYAVLAALTFPSVLYSTSSLPSAIAGCVVGIYFAYKNKGLVFVALVTMMTSYIVSFIC